MKKIDNGDTPQVYIDLGDGQGPVDASFAPKSDPDRIFRNAWSMEGKAIVVDMDKAREILVDSLRSERKPLLEGLDVESVRADEDGKPKTDIIARKKALRDVTKDPRIKAAKTPAELSALTLDVLLKA